MKPFCSRTRVVRTPHSENKLIMSQVGANKSGERVLFLIVKRADFNVMVTGEKAVEFRKKTRCSISATVVLAGPVGVSPASACLG